MHSTLRLPPRARSRMRIRSGRKIRSCLMCGKNFKSEGPHNRRCPRCNYILEHAREGTYYEPRIYSLEGKGGSEPFEID